MQLVTMWLLVGAVIGGQATLEQPKYGQFFETQAQCEQAIPVVAHLVHEPGKRLAFRCTEVKVTQ